MPVPTTMATQQPEVLSETISTYANRVLATLENLNQYLASTENPIKIDFSSYIVKPFQEDFTEWCNKNCVLLTDDTSLDALFRRKTSATASQRSRETTTCTQVAVSMSLVRFKDYLREVEELVKRETKSGAVVRGSRKINQEKVHGQKRMEASEGESGDNVSSKNSDLGKEQVTDRSMGLLQESLSELGVEDEEKERLQGEEMEGLMDQLDNRLEGIKELMNMFHRRGDFAFLNESTAPASFSHIPTDAVVPTEEGTQ